VSIVVRQAVLLGSIGIVFSLVIVALGRSGRLSFRFVIGWLSLGLLLVLGSLFVFVLSPLSELLGVPSPTIGLAFGILISIVISVELSISSSRAQDQLRDAAEAIALLEARVRELESKTDK
jgi:energy-coupling factor transporter transmembrane protein EcfT